MTDTPDASNPTVPKRVPVQERAQVTYEKLLQAAGELIGEVGIDSISTNRIVERAGLTPPAFYRYFKDKYDILATLGARLMEAQNAIIAEHSHETADYGPFRLKESAIEAILIGTVEVTRSFPGGPWLTRALRAVPVLQDVRLKSHQAMAHFLAETALEENPDRDPARLYQVARLAVDIGYCAIEMVLEEPELDVTAIMRDTAHAIAALSDHE